MSHARLHDAAGLVASSLLVVLTASPGADGACNATCARDIERCMATQCDGTPRAACRRRCKPAAIRTLVYALSECREDAGHSFVGHQALRVRRGDREPITLVEFGPSEPVPDPIGLCQAYARAGFGNESVLMLPLQRLGVSPDGSAVVFEVNDQAPFFRSISLAPEANGFFLVRPDGTGRRRLGPPSRDPSFRVGPEFGKIFPISLGFIFTFAPPVVFSPNGGRIAFTDVGPGPNGEDAVQIVVLDLASGRRTMTHLPSGTPPPVGGNPAVSPFFLTCCPRFLGRNTHRRSQSPSAPRVFGGREFDFQDVGRVLKLVRTGQLFSL